jgi:tRNA-splicing ligase RtcB (3'-phosphate/5'-hydroxy nucleic acid ligase)
MPRAHRSLSTTRPSAHEGDRPASRSGSLQAVDEVTWRLQPDEEMRVPAILFATKRLVDAVEDSALSQLRNVATLPGIVDAAYAMPDVHSGYGFPIGGVAATDVVEGGVVSPGGVGFDISCGVRLLAAPLTRDDLAPRLGALMDELDRSVPRGLGRGGTWRIDDEHAFADVLRGGVQAAIGAGLANDDDLEYCEDHGIMGDADPEAVSDRALERGVRQLGSLGSGNHFLEVQVVDEVYDSDTASAFGLHSGQVCVMIHCGSRGLGHQICSDHVRLMFAAMRRFELSVPDRQLACAPVDSLEGETYLRAMNAAANYARANRQALTAVARRAFASTVGTGSLVLCYDVSHNLARLERHAPCREERLLCVHRKGATPALPPGSPALPERFERYGQPVLVPGSMGTASYVLAGVATGRAFSSTCHGAGRTMSRHAAVKSVRVDTLLGELEQRQVAVRATSARGLVEEAPEAYKDVNEVVAVCERAGLARRVARLVPIGVVKG